MIRSLILVVASLMLAPAADIDAQVADSFPQVARTVAARVIGTILQGDADEVAWTELQAALRAATEAGPSGEGVSDASAPNMARSATTRDPAAEQSGPGPSVATTGSLNRVRLLVARAAESSFVSGATLVLVILLLVLGSGSLFVGRARRRGRTHVVAVSRDAERLRARLRATRAA